MRLVNSQHSRGVRAFTMVEIALSIAVVAFALVAILGVLPTGMTVQKDNRDDSVIDQDGHYWLEAIRGGARGLEDITNYVESITITNLTNKKFVTFDNGPTGIPLRSQDIIALLSTPKYMHGDTNRVFARVKAITGPASEKGSLTNEFSFRYELQVEITPSTPLPPSYVASVVAATGNDSLGRYNATLENNLQEIRLILRWPLVERGNGWFVGGNRKVFRARVAGNYAIETNLTTTVANSVRSTFGTNLVVIAPNRFDAL